METKCPSLSFYPELLTSLLYPKSLLEKNGPHKYNRNHYAQGTAGVELR
jgi:hypothetical protein